MAGNKTHEQQRRIIEERVDTANAGDDFDVEKDLKRPPAVREALRKGAGLKHHDGSVTDPDDRNIVRGENQESEHKKRRQDD